MFRRGEASIPALLTIITAYGGYVVGVFMPYATGAIGGVLHIIAMHENKDFQITRLTVFKTIFVATIGGGVAVSFGSHAEHISKEFLPWVGMLGGFMSWEVLMFMHDKKQTLVRSAFSRIFGKKQDNLSDRDGGVK